MGKCRVSVWSAENSFVPSVHSGVLVTLIIVAWPDDLMLEQHCASLFWMCIVGILILCLLALLNHKSHDYRSRFRSLSTVVSGCNFEGVSESFCKLDRTWENVVDISRLNINCNYKMTFSVKQYSMLIIQFAGLLSGLECTSYKR